MGTTLTALQAGSTNYVYVVAIEGCKYLLTNAATTAAALTAWARESDYTLCLGGLFVDIQHDQKINPWEPFGSGGRCKLTVAQDASDTFGIYVHRKGGGSETVLTVELDNDDTVVEVKQTTLFDATGEIHIGTECIAYTGVTPAAPGVGGKFTGCTRGKYSPFGPEGSLSDGTHFGNRHRVGLDAQSVKLQPVVSSIPRIWAGRRVGVWMHRVVDGVLDVIAEAQCVYAGRLVDVRDDPGGISTVIECEHVLDEIKEGTLGRDLWSCKAKAGIYMEDWFSFQMRDDNSTNDDRIATTLHVVPGGASGAAQMNEGFYTHAELHAKLEAWWTAELAASRLWGTYAISIQDEADGPRTKIYATIPDGGSPLPGFSHNFTFKMPSSVAKFFGYSTTAAPLVGPSLQQLYKSQPGDSEEYYPGDLAPLRAVMFTNSYAGPPNLFALNMFDFSDEQGEFFDQADYWPGAAPASTVANRGWGIFLIDGKFLAKGMLHPTLDRIGGVSPMFLGSTDDITGVSTTEYNGTDYIDVRQILILEAPLWKLLYLIFYSTGTHSFNNTDYDLLPAGCGLAIPADLLGLNFRSSVFSMPGVSNSTVMVFDKPTSLTEMLAGDLIMRRGFPYWKDGRVLFGSWRAPTTQNAVHTLSESNKAEPAGSGGDDKHRSVTAQSTEWVRSVVKIEYNRDIKNTESDGSYRDSITFEDSTAVDDAGGRAKLFTIKARNTYGEYAAGGAGIQALASEFLAFLPMVSRPAWKIRRSIDCRYFEGLSVGDVVLYSDEFARDPITGTRGIQVRPAIVTMHKYSLGGAAQGSDDPDPMGGEVELFFTDTNPTLQSPYAPAADVDYSATTGGFDAGYSVSEVKLRCFQHHYGQTVDSLLGWIPIVLEDDYDATHFVAGHKIKIIERDPIDLTAPVIWQRTVASQTGSDIVLTAALSSPTWDPSRKYRVVFDDYDVAVSAQRAWVFSASSIDGLIQDTAQPYLYGSGSPTSAYEANPAQSAAELVELVPDIITLDGAGRDVGYERQIAKLADAIIDYKATSSPMLFNQVLTNTTNVTGYQLVAATPLYMMWELLSGSVRREISVAPMFRSNDGRVVYLRLSLYRLPPTSSTLDDQSPGLIYDGAVFITTSTEWVIPDADVLFAEIKDWEGMVWLQVECSYLCETYGIARFSEGARST